MMSACRCSRTRALLSNPSRSPKFEPSPIKHSGMRQDSQRNGLPRFAASARGHFHSQPLGSFAAGDAADVGKGLELRGTRPRPPMFPVVNRQPGNTDEFPVILGRETQTAALSANRTGGKTQTGQWIVVDFHAD